MKKIHYQEKEQFIKLFKQARVDRFEDRFKILDVFLKTEQHLTADELASLINQNGVSLERDFVRDTLRLMCRYGFASKERFGNGVTRYEHRHLGQHHDHMICTKCRKIIEFKNDQLEDLQVKIARETGFHMLQHKMEIYGICAGCLKDRVSLMPLDSARQGERLMIKDFIGGAASRMRLLSMGLRIGDEIEVVTNDGGGQVVFALDYNRLALGRGMAGKILVEPTQGNNG